MVGFLPSMGLQRDNRGWPPEFSREECSGVVVKKLPADAEDAETQVRFLGQEDPLEEGMATHSRIPAWRIPMDRGAWRATVLRVTKSRTWC